ncbi:MAG: hypothetical protein IIA92_13730 [Chloroflexi bacterium]|nr:hypothetical protein [Chloroflexota bacterium]
MTTIDGQLWQRCVECETLVPAPARNYAGLCPNCAAAPEPEAVDQDQGETMEITAGDVG